MSKKLPYYLSCLIAALSFVSASGQEYQPLPITSGYNADVIANGVGSSATTSTHGVDAIYAYVATDFKPTASSPAINFGVPVSGVITTLVTGTQGLTYQLGPLSGNNSLRLANATTLTGTLVLTTPKPVVTLYVLGVTGGGSGAVNVVVTFTDDTTQDFNNVSVGDWYWGGSAAIQGLGRVNRGTDGLDVDSSNPRMYQIPLSITPGNQSKSIKSVKFTKTAATGDAATNIFALSADVVPSCPAPTNLTATAGLASAIISWTPAVTTPAGGYDIYYSTANTAPTTTTTPLGNVASTSSTYYASGLTVGSPYYFWVRSNCSGTDKGVWRMVQTATGVSTEQTTYTGGEISTNYNSGPNVNSVTDCPASMAIVVPAGYKVAGMNTTYTMTAWNNGYQSEQRSMLYNLTNSVGEASLAQGSGQSGTYSYNRSGINIANDLTGTINIQMRAWRTWQGGEPNCSVTYNKVDAGTWKIRLTLAPAATCVAPPAPVAGTQSICPGSVVGQLSVTGVPNTYFRWYTTASGGTEIPYSTLVVSGNYYVSQVTGTCEGPRTGPVAVTVEPTPVPTSGPIAICGLSKVQDLTVNGSFGSTLNWYDAENDSTPLAGTTPLVTKTYYVSQTVAGCESVRLAVAVTVDTIPLPVATDQFFCSSATVGNLLVSGETGGVFKWYAAADGGTALASTDAIGTATYYVTQTLRGCESARKPVIATIGTIVNPTVYAQELCAGSTVADLEAFGGATATFKWFATADATTQLDAATVVESGTYYVSQQMGDCESGRSAHTVTINNVGLPVIENQTLCAASTVAALEADVSEEDTVNWYATEESTIKLSPNALLETGTYFAALQHNDCEGAKVAVEVTINEPTPAPAVTSVSVCVNSTVADLDPQYAEGVTAKWYATATSINPLASTVAVSAGTLYLSQTIAGCEGPRAAVAIIISVIPAPVSGEQTACNGSTFGDVTVEGAEGATFKWYGSEIGTDLFESTSEVISGTYYVSQVVNGCEGARSQIVLTTSAITIPSPESLQDFCGSAVVGDLDAGLSENATANWYDANSQPLTLDTPLVNGTYILTQSIGICESELTAVLVTINPIPAAPTGSAQQDFIFGDNLSHFDIDATEGATIKWYILVDGEWQSIPNGSILVDGNTYGVSQTINGCEGPKFSIEANLVLGTDTFDIKNLVVYPNPSSDIVNVEANETIAQVSVFNLLGQEVIRQDVNGTKGNVNIASLPQATYVMQIKTEGGATATLKVVKR
ncbi:hypothetical protein AMR72_04950 [Flavobacterium psychrophilum]|nr:hypothetical protein AMR72_04950 [Flavobacterium psychrophilum]AOE51921.1 hypothetical protein ALW18_04945 [Flavobacterium psychrophilum]